jgi:ferredoxin
LLQKGYSCTIYDENEQPGGMLRYSDCSKKLDAEVLDKEIGAIEKLGARFCSEIKVDSAYFMDIRKEFDAVFVATGQSDDHFGLEAGENGIKTNNACQTNIPSIFAGGGAAGRRRIAVGSVADGKNAAVAIDEFLSGAEVIGPQKKFNNRIGKLLDGEIENFMLAADNSSQVSPIENGKGFTKSQAKQESARCLHCDCRKADSCQLREYSQQYKAVQNRYKGERNSFSQQIQHHDIIYEPGKCIKCGLCIQIASRAKEKLGLTFIGRGFDVKVAVPFDRTIAEGLIHIGKECVEACPTAALAVKD